MGLVKTNPPKYERSWSARHHCSYLPNLSSVILHILFSDFPLLVISDTLQLPSSLSVSYTTTCHSLMQVLFLLRKLRGWNFTVLGQYNWNDTEKINVALKKTWLRDISLTFHRMRRVNTADKGPSSWGHLEQWNWPNMILLRKLSSLSLREDRY